MEDDKPGNKVDKQSIIARLFLSEKLHCLGIPQLMLALCLILVMSYNFVNTNTCSSHQEKTNRYDKHRYNVIVFRK